MNLSDTLTIYATGTSEGAKKGWDTRGRGRAQDASVPAAHKALAKKLKHNLDTIQDEKASPAQRVKASEAALAAMKDLHKQVKMTAAQNTKFGKGI